MSTTTKRPSEAQRRALEALAAGRDPAGHVRTMSESGGFWATWQSLRRRGWVQGDEITEAGRQAIAPTAQAQGGA